MVTKLGEEMKALSSPTLHKAILEPKKIKRRKASKRR